MVEKGRPGEMKDQDHTYLLLTFGISTALRPSLVKNRFKTLKMEVSTPSRAWLTRETGDSGSLSSESYQLFRERHPTPFANFFTITVSNHRCIVYRHTPVSSTQATSNLEPPPPPHLPDIHSALSSMCKKVRLTSGS